MIAGLRSFLPDHPAWTYEPANVCIYCGKAENLEDEHIVPYGLGGRWVLPAASCRACAGLSSAFEGTCLRTMFGPLRMLYDLPSRRRRDRPHELPLKVRKTPGSDWSEVLVPREEFPFLVVLPNFLMPDLLSGYTTTSGRGAESRKFWIRGASEKQGFKLHLSDLCGRLGVHMVQPVGEARVEEFCLMLAKIAHSFAVAELGYGSFEPLLEDLILNRNLSNRAKFIGGLSYTEAPTNQLHEIRLDRHVCDRPDLVSVRVRLLAKLDTPTYYVVAGRHLGLALGQQ